MKKNPILRTLAFAMILIVLLIGCATRTQAVQETDITKVASSVKEIQKYGNLVLTIEKKDLDAMGAEYGDVFTVSFQDTEVYAPYCTNYSDVDLGSIVLRNDGETLILAINMETLLPHIPLLKRSPIQIRPTSGYLRKERQWKTYPSSSLLQEKENTGMSG